MGKTLSWRLWIVLVCVVAVWMFALAIWIVFAGVGKVLGKRVLVGKMGRVIERLLVGGGDLVLFFLVVLVVLVVLAP
jgi:hypothetical protein